MLGWRMCVVGLGHVKCKGKSECVRRDCLGDADKAYSSSIRTSHARKPKKKKADVMSYPRFCRVLSFMPMDLSEILYHNVPFSGESTHRGR